MGVPVPSAAGVRIGFRLEFFESPSHESPRGFAGGAYCEEAFLAAAVPQAGDLVALSSLAGSPGALLSLGPATAGPFLRVDRVEHYPVPVGGDGASPPWWHKNYEAGVQVLILAQAPASVHSAVGLVRELRDKGRAVSGTSDPDSTAPLDQALAELNRHRSRGN
jgi:hypothetical protein